MNKHVPLSIVASALLLSSTLALSSPSGGVVKSGSANIVHVDKTTNINQSSNSASINWNTFNIAKDESVNFNQPSSSSITLNRVIGTEKSIISGALNANGQVWILNSNGVLFGKTASINTSGLLATTKEISTDSFKSKDYTLQGNSINSVINDGSINIKSNGYVILAANEVQNSGVIKAIRGRVHLVGANSISINLNGNSLISLTVNKGVLDSLVKNSGDIYADGGEIYLSTNAKNELLKGVVNNTGLIEANSIDDLEGKTYNGKIELFAHGGTAEVGGVINAKDGFVETSGREFSILSDADINAGEWLIDPYYVNIDESLAGIIVTALASGDVTINAETGTHTPGTITGGTSADTSSIDVNSAITWGTSSKLTLTADKINVNKPITWSDTSASLSLNATSSVAFDSSITSWTTSNNLFTATSNTATIIINNLFQLQEMNTKLSGNYELGSDIDAGDTKLSSYGDGKGWTPIGAFTGIFDGNSKTISSLFINRLGEKFIGLFGSANSATIENVRLTGVDITGNTYTGGLIGYANDTTTKNSFVSGNIKGFNNVGGLIGSNAGSGLSKIDNSYYATGTVTGVGNVGGLIGINASGSTITGTSHATGNVTGTTNVGGLIGQNKGSDLESANLGDIFYNIGTVKGSQSVGGVIGLNDGSSITNFSSGSSAKVEGSSSTKNSSVGGLVGFNKSSTITASSSAATLAVEGSSSDSTGGLVGYNYSSSKIIDSHATGAVVGVKFVGGLVGYNRDSTITGTSYAIGDVTGSNSVGGLVGFNYKADLTSGTLGDIYYAVGSVRGAQQVGGLIGRNFNSSITNFYAKSSATVKGADSGDNMFIGGLIGKNLGKTITNSSSAATVIGGGTTSTYIGGLIGENAGGKITKSSSMGAVTGITYVGGLVGINDTKGTIENSYTTGTVTGGDKVGGLVGYSTNKSKIINSYEMGKVTGTTNVGGLVGLNDSGSAIIHSYYDLTVNPIESIYKEGRTKLELQDINTFIGWDIVIDSTDKSIKYPTFNTTSSSTIWKIYPTSIPADKMSNIITPVINGSLTQVSYPSQKTLVDSLVLNSYTTSTPSQNQANRVITLSQRRAYKEDKTEDIRTPIENNSIIELINKGINLPKGVDQEFYVTSKREIKKTKGVK